MGPDVYRAVPETTIRDGLLTALSFGLPNDLNPSVCIVSVLEADGLGARIASRARYGSRSNIRIFVYRASIADIENIGLSVRHRPSEHRGLAARDPRKLIGPAHAEIVGLREASNDARKAMVESLTDIFHQVAV